MKTTNILDDVKNTPVAPDGDGFLILGIQAESVVGSDGNVYTRRNGIISIADE